MSPDLASTRVSSGRCSASISFRWVRRKLYILWSMRAHVLTCSCVKQDALHTCSRLAPPQGSGCLYKDSMAVSDFFSSSRDFGRMVADVHRSSATFLR